MTYFRIISGAGFAATAITYGPGRMGFGLFVPELKSEIGMSSSAVGFVSSLGFLGFFLALLVAQAMLVRLGPKTAVVTGLMCAATGMAVVAIAPSIAVLAVGVFLASASAGFAWTPFNDAVNRKVGTTERPTALSLISTGTSMGIVLAAAAAFAAQAAGFSWRACWAAFSVTAAMALLANWFGLRSVGPSPAKVTAEERRGLGDPFALPLYAVAFVLGTISAIYIAFAADHIRDTGPLPGLQAGLGPAALFLVYGISGLAGLLTDRLRRRIGLVTLLRALMVSGALSMVIIVLWPSMWIALVPSAAAQGVAVMMTSAVLSFWSDRLFPTLPSLAFTVALLAYAAGSVIGPAVAGMAVAAVGTNAMFVGAAGLPALMLAGLSRRFVRETAIRPAARDAPDRVRRAA